MHMDPLIIGESEVLPAVVFDPGTKKFEIRGKSIPSDGKAFYGKILEWLDAYSKQPLMETHFDFNLEFFNIGTSKMLLFILHKLNDIKSAGNEVSINWHYAEGDEDMVAMGEDYASMVDMPFNFVPKTQVQDYRPHIS